MYRHLLVPTDGSPLADKAVEQAVSIAKSVQAKLTFFYAAADESSSILDEGDLLRSIDPGLLARRIKQHKQDALGTAEAIDEKGGVSYQLCSTVSDDPFEAIIDAAEDNGCDLILMASHGYRGIKGMLLGSQTQKVLTHSKIPVLVYR